MGNSAKILVFDSGVGGLSILREVRRQLPGCRYAYACDNQAFPYGAKREDALVQRVDAVLKALTRKLQPDIVVVACNTASTVALPRIRSHFSKPVVGVVPAVKPAATLVSKTKTIGLLGTPGTVARQYTRQLINDFASDCSVVRVGSSAMVEMAEAKLRGEQFAQQQLADITAPFFDDAKLDTIVLACTHFPLLLDELRAIAPRPVNWVDSGEAIARRVATLLHPAQAASPETASPNETRAPAFACLMTADHRGNAALRASLSHFGCDRMETFRV